MIEMSIDSDKLTIPSKVSEAIQVHTGVISDCTPVGGGCIAHATRIAASRGTYFLKWGASHVSQTFGAEARGLQELAQANSPLAVPEVIAYESGGQGYILLEWLHQGHASSQSWQAFGRGLAGLHRFSSESYGYRENNYIGRSPQVNDQRASWPDFFRDCRLEPQVHMAREAGRWRSGWNDWYETLLKRLGDLLPHQPSASLVHGDLWGGNFMTMTNGQVALIDPAVYYGHREVDLAMTELFGGFNKAFYEAYWEAWPVDGGYAERRDLYNLYHLLNHLNLFGGSYERGVEKALKRFGG